MKTDVDREVAYRKMVKEKKREIERLVEVDPESALEIARTCPNEIDISMMSRILTEISMKKMEKSRAK